MNIKSKLPDVETSIFTIMTKLATDYSALNMSQGFPDFDVNPDLINLVERYMHAGYNQYSPMQGIEVLRKKIANKTELSYGAKIDSTSQITVTSGATEAIFCAISTVINYGDEVIIFDPAFDCYAPAVRLNGGLPIHIPMLYPGYKIDWNKVEESVSAKTRMIILNSPHNPTGTILLREDIDALSDIVLKNNMFILSDEVYEHIIFDDLFHESILRYSNLLERSFVISSFGKTYHTTGWKIGYCIAPEYLMNEFRKVHQFVTFASNTPIQYAYSDILDDVALYLHLSSFYVQKRNLFLDLISNSRFKALKCDGTYFLMLDYSNISEQSDFDFAKRLITEYGIAAIPPSVLYDCREDNKVLRFCFAKKNETLREAAGILCKI